MNLFLISWREEGGLDAAISRGALERLLERLDLGFLDPARIETWTAPSGCCAFAFVSHRTEQTGGVRYAALETHRAALFSGRPYRWTDDFTADGRGPLDPSFYLQPAQHWADSLDGRCAAVRYDDSERVLEIWTDPLGAYPVFTAASPDGVRWTSNNPTLLYLLRGGGAGRPESIAGLLGGGWPLSGDPVWEGVDRLPRGGIQRSRAGAASGRQELLPVGRIATMLGSGFDRRAAAALLVESLRALADWPGRPSVVPVTAGRDSRLILAAATHAGLEFEATTGGAPDSADVTIGRLLSEARHVPHTLMDADPLGDMWSRPRDMAQLVQLVSGGTACVADAAGYPFGPRPGPLLLWHSGQGGEIARGYYGSADGLERDALVRRLYRTFVGRRPGRQEVLSAEGAELVQGQIGSWVDEQLAVGVTPADVPDMFYLLIRMGTWAGPGHGCVELVRDTTSPLWSRRLLPHQLGLPAAGRMREQFHLEVLRELGPDLVDMPFQDGHPWQAPRSPIRRRLRRGVVLGRKGWAEARRRAPILRRRAHAPKAAQGVLDGAPHPFAYVQAQIAEAVRSQPSHQAWNVLDRSRVERLLERDPAGLDDMSRYYVWRLGQVFWDESLG